MTSLRKVHCRLRGKRLLVGFRGGYHRSRQGSQEWGIYLLSAGHCWSVSSQEALDRRRELSAGHTVGQNIFFSKGGFKHHMTLILDKGQSMKCQKMAFLVGNRKCKHETEPEETSWELRERPTRKKAGTDTQVSECPRKGPLKIVL